MSKLTATATQARTEMAQKVLEGLRDEAFELARDISFDVLTQAGGLLKFVEQLRDVVFPLASEEARELFKTGQKPGSPARQIKSLCCRTYLGDDDGGNSSRPLIAASSYQNQGHLQTRSGKPCLVL